MASHPNSMNSDLQMSFVGLWQRVLPHPEELSAIISPVTLSVLQRAMHPKSTWDRMEAFLTRLLKHELLFPIPFEHQIVILLQLEWNPVSDGDVTDKLNRRMMIMLKCILYQGINIPVFTGLIVSSR